MDNFRESIRYIPQRDIRRDTRYIPRRDISTKANTITNKKLKSKFGRKNCSCCSCIRNYCNRYWNSDSKQ